MLQAASQFRVPLMFAGRCVIAAMGIATYVVFALHRAARDGLGDARAGHAFRRRLSGTRRDTARATRFSYSRCQTAHAPPVPAVACDCVARPVSSRASRSSPSVPRPSRLYRYAVEHLRINPREWSAARALVRIAAPVVLPRFLPARERETGGRRKAGWCISAPATCRTALIYQWTTYTTMSALGESGRAGLPDVFGF